MGVIGYSALSVMLIDTALIWRYWIKGGDQCRMPRSLNTYTRIAFGWRVVAYIAGAIITVTLESWQDSPGNDPPLGLQNSALSHL